jgi:hypothetical protein
MFFCLTLSSTLPFSQADSIVTFVIGVGVIALSRIQQGTKVGTEQKYKVVSSNVL